MPVPDLQLSVWIVNYNSADALTRCLPGLATPSVRRIVVCDNGSQPGEVTALRRMAAADARITLLESAVNLGFGGGLRHIAEATDPEPAEWVWILNPDTEFEPAVVEELCRADTADTGDILSPTIVTGPPDRPRNWFHGGDIDVRAGRVVPFDGPAGDVRPTAFVSGAAMLLSRATWERLGGFRTDLFLYWEDVELCLRARAAGLRLAVLPQTIWHAEGGSSESGRGTSAVAYYYSARNRVLVCAQFGGAAGLVVGRGVRMTARWLARAVFKERRDRRAKVVAILRGSWDGVRGRTGPTY